MAEVSTTFLIRMAQADRAAAEQAREVASLLPGGEDRKRWMGAALSYEDRADTLEAMAASVVATSGRLEHERH